VCFAIVLIAAGLLLIEAAARVWLALSSGPRAAQDVRTGAVETAWFDILEQDLKTDAAAPRLYQPDAELFWRLRPASKSRTRSTRPAPGRGPGGSRSTPRASAARLRPGPSQPRR
jgi:hypothetical protein